MEDRWLSVDEIGVYVQYDVVDSFGRLMEIVK